MFNDENHPYSNNQNQKRFITGDFSSQPFETFSGVKIVSVLSINTGADFHP